MNRHKLERIQLILNNMSSLISCMQKELDEIKDQEKEEVSSLNDANCLFYPHDYDEVFND